MLTSGSPSTAFSTARTTNSTGSITKTRLETTGSVELGRQPKTVDCATLNMRGEVTQKMLYVELDEFFYVQIFRKIG